MPQKALLEIAYPRDSVLLSQIDHVTEHAYRIVSSWFHFFNKSRARYKSSIFRMAWDLLVVLKIKTKDRINMASLAPNSILITCKEGLLGSN